MADIDTWYALRSKPNKEKSLFLQLKSRGIEAYYPELRLRPVNPRSRLSRPFFPGYLFVHTDAGRVGFSDLHWLPFSLGLVAFDACPAQISWNVIQGIKDQVEHINACGQAEFEGIRRGELLLIHKGPFAGYEAIFDIRRPGQERVMVLLKLLNSRYLPLELNAGDIRRKTSRPPH